MPEPGMVIFLFVFGGIIYLHIIEKTLYEAIRASNLGSIDISMISGILP